MEAGEKLVENARANQSADTAPSSGRANQQADTMPVTRAGQSAQRHRSYMEGPISTDIDPCKDEPISTRVMLRRKGKVQNTDELTKR